MIWESLSLVLGESLMSLYPILIKTVDTNLFTQVIVRVITFIVISFFFLSTSVWSIMTNPSYLMISVLNLFHIFSSYIGFTNLDVGVALSLFYLYPLINVLIKSLFITNQFDQRVIIYFLLSLIGVYLITFQSADTDRQIKMAGIGVVAILLAAISESLIYTFYKIGGDLNPFDMLFTLYFWGGLILTAGVIISSYFKPEMRLIDANRPLLWKLALANLIIGVAGHTLRFYSLPKISTEWYSILAFLEVIFGFILGRQLLGEKINRWHLIGTGMIFFSVYKINQFGY